MRVCAYKCVRVRVCTCTGAHVCRCVWECVCACRGTPSPRADTVTSRPGVEPTRNTQHPGHRHGPAGRHEWSEDLLLDLS